MKHDLTSKNQAINTESNPPRTNRPGLRLIKCGPETVQESIAATNSKKPFKSLFANQLKTLADSLDAEVEMILKL